jgi:hypothetical protein
MNGGTLWYSVPTNAVHNFYVNGTTRCEINGTGAIITGALTVNGNMNINSSGTNINF